MTDGVDDDSSSNISGRSRVRMPIPRASAEVPTRAEMKARALEQKRQRQVVTKTHDAVALRPKKGKLTLLARRLFNALLYHAQLQGIDQDRYSINLSTLIQDARFNSNNTKYVKDLVVEMQSVQIQWQTRDESNGKTAWHSVPLIGGVTIETFDKRGADPVIWWAYDPLCKDLLVNPVQYTKILLEISAQARSFAAAALYEVGAKYATSPSNLTMREDVAWWIPVLTGNSAIPAKFEYGIFKRDTLTPALAEVGALSPDFSLELIEHKRGRKVEQLQFRVIPKQQSNAPAGALPEPLDLTLIDRIVAIGIKRPDAEDFCATVPRSKLEAAVSHVEQRMANVAMSPIQSVTAYLRHAIATGYADLSIEVETSMPGPKADQQSLFTAQNSAEVREVETLRTNAEAAFNAMSDAERDECIELFEGDCLPTLSAPIAKQWREKRLQSPLAKARFLAWFGDTFPA